MKNIFLFLLPVFLLCPPLAEAKTQTAKVSVDVSAGQYKAVRLKNLPLGSAVKVDIKCAGAVTVVFASEEQYKKYPDIDRPLFESTVRERFNFTVAVPATGNYHLVFDNTSGSRTVTVDAVITGSSGNDAAPLLGEKGDGQADSGGKDVPSIGRELSALFMFKPFTLSLRKCEGKDSSAGPDVMVLCLEYMKSLSDSLGPQNASTALLFTLYHEAGHILLSQWDYPFSDHEDVANEFAAMTFALLGQREKLNDLIEQLRAGRQTGDLLAGKFKGKLHSLSREQAASIALWVKDDQRLKGWQKILVPHMQTAMLERIVKSPPSWADTARVKKELALRKQTTVF